MVCVCISTCNRYLYNIYHNEYVIYIYISEPCTFLLHKPHS